MVLANNSLRALQQIKDSFRNKNEEKGTELSTTCDLFQ